MKAWKAKKIRAEREPGGAPSAAAEDTSSAAPATAAKVKAEPSSGSMPFVFGPGVVTARGRGVRKSVSNRKAKLSALEERRRQLLEKRRQKAALNGTRRRQPREDSVALKMELELEQESAPLPQNPGRVLGEGSAAMDTGAAAAAETPGMDGSDDTDPLDAFMQEITSELQTQTNAVDVKKEGTEGGSGDDLDDDSTQLGRRGERFFGDENDLGEEDIPEEEDEPSWLQRSLKGKKDLPVVDHSQMDYPPFRKDFYLESPEIR